MYLKITIITKKLFINKINQLFGILKDGKNMKGLVNIMQFRKTKKMWITPKKQFEK